MRTWHLIKISAKDSLTYRADFVMSWLSGSLLIIINYYLWFHVFSRRAEIGGYNFSETFSYMAMVWVLSGFLNSSPLSRNVQNAIVTGRISYDLCLPVHYPRYTLIKSYAGAVIYLGLSGLPIFVTAAALFGMPVPAPVPLILFIISIHLSFVTAFSISFLIGMMTVYFKEIEGLLQAERFLRMIFSGALLPLAFLPALLQNASEWLPFQTIVSIPVRIFLESVPLAQMVKYLGVQLVWLIVVCGIVMVSYRRCVHRLEAFGG